MKDLSSIVATFESLTRSIDNLEKSFAARIVGVAQWVFASFRAFLHRQVTPQGFERFERRLERLFREMARLLPEITVNQIESSQRPEPVTWEHCTFKRYARRERSIETRVGTIRYRRGLHKSEYSFFVRGIAPLGKRLGLTGNRVSPEVAHKLGRLVADLPQQAAVSDLSEHFGVDLSVDAYRRVVKHVSSEIRFRHDEAAIDQLHEWIEEAVKTKGKHEVLLVETACMSQCVKA